MRMWISETYLSTKGFFWWIRCFFERKTSVFEIFGVYFWQVIHNIHKYPQVFMQLYTIKPKIRDLTKVLTIGSMYVIIIGKIMSKVCCDKK